MIRRKKVIITALPFLFVLLSFLAIPVIYSVSDRLSETSRVKANLLIIEGWLPPYAIEMGYDEFVNNDYDYVITTGIEISGYYQISMNGYLVFYPGGRFERDNITEDHIIGINAYSESEGEDCAHFSIYVNDSLAGDFLADKKKRVYQVQWRGRSDEIDSVLIHFDNDKFDETGDRNLYVKELIFDDETQIPYQHNSVYDIGLLDGKRRLNNNFNSHAEIARNLLLSKGLDSSLVCAVPGKRVRINRTLSSALAFSEWIKTSDIDIKGINIVTRGTHARRTLFTYNKILEKRYEIGIISLPDYKEHSRKYKVLKTIREAIGLVYYWFILIPY